MTDEATASADQIFGEAVSRVIEALNVAAAACARARMEAEAQQRWVEQTGTGTAVAPARAGAVAWRDAARQSTNGALARANLAQRVQREVDVAEAGLRESQERLRALVRQIAEARIPVSLVTGRPLKAASRFVVEWELQQAPASAND